MASVPRLRIIPLRESSYPTPPLPPFPLATGWKTATVVEKYTVADDGRNLGLNRAWPPDPRLHGYQDVNAYLTEGTVSLTAANHTLYYTELRM